MKTSKRWLIFFNPSHSRPEYIRDKNIFVNSTPKYIRAD